MVEVSMLMRRVAAAPGTYLAAVVSLAFGIGAVIGVHGIVDATLLKPLQGISTPGLVALYSGDTPTASNTHRYRAADILSERHDLFLDVARYGWFARDQPIDAAGLNARGLAVMVSANYFRTLGVRMALGRTFGPAEHSVGAPEAVIISHAFWRARFGGEPSVLGRSLKVGELPAVVVGVAPRGFRGTDVSIHPSLYLPIELTPRVSPAQLEEIDWLGDRSPMWFHIVARLRPGVSIEAANAALRSWAKRETDRPRCFVASGCLIELQRSAIPPRMWNEFRVLVLLFTCIAVAMVVVASATVGALFLVRAEARRRDHAVCLALGASGGRLIFAAWVESLSSCLAGAALALPLAYAIPRAVALLAPRSGAIFNEIRMPFNLRVLTGAIAATVVVSGIVTAVAYRVRFGGSIWATLHGGVGPPPIGRAGGRRIVTVAQVALTMALVSGAFLFARSVRASYSVDVGYETEELVEATVDLVFVRMADDARRALLAEIEEALRRSLPSVRFGRREPEWVAFGSPRVSSGEPAARQADRSPSAVVQPVTLGYLDALGMPLLEGRTLVRDDFVNGPVHAVITARLARQLAPGRSAVGARLDLGMGDARAIVVGVVGNVRLDFLGPQLRLAFVPAGSPPPTLTTFAIRTSQAAVVGQVVRSALGRWPAASVRVGWARDRIAREAAVQRLGLAAFGVVGLVAMVLAMLSLYVLIASTITARMTELGIRIALGAPTWSTGLMLGRQTLLPVVAGLVVGGGVTMAGGRLLETLLFGVDATDPVSVVGAGVLLLAASIVTVLAPILRAAKLHPSDVLRQS